MGPALRFAFGFPLAAALTLLAAGLSAQTRTPTAQELARSVGERYDRVHDFSADFSHTYEGGILKKTTTEKGTLQIKKPGRMRWEYTSPEHKLFVSDGQKIYSYVPADRQVIVTSMPAQDQATTAILFLVGKGDLARDFTASFAEGGAPDVWMLKLVPKQRQKDYDWLVLGVDRQSLQIRTLVAAEHEGGRSTFQFSNYRENTGLADKTFGFKIPRGVDVINADSPSR
jgi:outer membrane lipoprotein carrier protein